MLNNDVYEQVQKNTDLVQLIKRSLELTPGRRAYKGNCPFHQDQNRSLMVSPEKNVFKCFGCGAEGGPVEFIAYMRGLSTPQAVEQLSLNPALGSVNVAS